MIARIVLLCLFVAIGVGLAVGLAFTMQLSPTDRFHGEPAASAGPLGQSPPSLSSTSTVTEAPSAASKLPDAPFPPWLGSMSMGPVVVSPAPRLASEFPNDQAASGLVRLLETINQRLESRPVESRPESRTIAQASQASEASEASNIKPALEPPDPGSSESATHQGITGESDQDLSINIQNIDIRAALEMLSEFGNLNILASNSVQGPVSASLQGVDLESALDAILQSTGYLARREGKFIYVGTAEDFVDQAHLHDTIKTRIYRPNYVTAKELETLIQPLVTEKVGVVSVSSPALQGIAPNDTEAGGDDFAGGEVVLVRDYQAVLTQIDQVVAEIDIRPLQVSIEAMILSVKLDDTNTFGVNFELLRNRNSIGVGWGSPFGSLNNVSFDGGLKFGFLDGSAGSFVDALERIGDTNVIATPRLMVINKHRAEILIGEQLGYVSTTLTETSASQTVEFLDVGAQLRLRPFISTDGLIRMEVHPELSTGSVEITPSFTIPNKEVTQVTTNVMVRNGCTVVIGGLMREELATTTSQIPMLGSLPMIGAIFRNKTETTERREILVLLTPRIVYEPETCAEGRQKACELRRRQDAYAQQMNPLGKRHVARRYLRKAQQARVYGDRDSTLRFAELAAHFDPMSQEALALKSSIAQENHHATSVDNAYSAEQPSTAALDGQRIAPWVFEDLTRQRSGSEPIHPLDPGVPGRHRDIQMQPR